MWEIRNGIVNRGLVFDRGVHVGAQVVCCSSASMDNLGSGAVIFDRCTSRHRIGKVCGTGENNAYEVFIVNGNFNGKMYKSPPYERVRHAKWPFC